MDVSLREIAAAPVITALVAMVGTAVPAVPRRMYPVLAVLIGMAWSVAAGAALDEVTLATPLEGLVVGLSASGLYSGVVQPGVRTLRGAS